MGMTYSPTFLSRAISLTLAATVTSVPALAWAQDSETTEGMGTIEVIGVTPTHGVGLPKEKIPYNVQSATAEDLERNQSLDLTDFMNRNLGSVSINDAQNNPLQPDIQFRGFSASPLLGLPQGIAVYQNSVRVNEALGDTINWDLIPESSIASINLISGANPLFGLNTLGGALSITTKNGFTHPGHSAEVYGGSFERVVTTFESGANNGTLGYYTTLQYFDEDGWRDLSESDALNLFTSLSYRNGATTSVDLNFNYADTDLIGNGAVPVELLNSDRDAIFTAPDQTENELFFLDLEGTHWINDITQISGNLFYRDNDTDSFNGDGTEFEECSFDDTILCEEEDGMEEAIEDQFGNNIAADGPNGERNGLNNISARRQRQFGGTLQTTFLGDLLGRNNQVIFGATWSQGLADFRSNTAVTSLDSDRSTFPSSVFVPEEGTGVDTRRTSWSLYITDTLSVTDRLDLTLSGRYNNININLDDKGGNSILTEPQPDLVGDHDFDRFNPAFGITYAFQPNVSGYFNYSESMRAPTAIELACAEPDAPCNLPNAFLADPPLDEVVAESFEGGFRGTFGRLAMLRNITWHLGGFHTTNEDDIIFQTTGGVQSNEGFFDNIGDTERVGMELNLTGQMQRLNWFLNYSFVKATFEDSFLVASANNPLADADGNIQVESGDDIPAIPNHTFKVGGTYAITSKLRVGGDVQHRSGVYLRGDEANLLDKTNSFTIVNIRGEYQFNKHFTMFARVDNLFDSDFETFGLLGEPDEVPGFENFEDNRFLGPGAPIAGFVGIRMRL